MATQASGVPDATQSLIQLSPDHGTNHHSTIAITNHASNVRTRSASTTGEAKQKIEWGLQAVWLHFIITVPLMLSMLWSVSLSVAAQQTEQAVRYLTFISCVLCLSTPILLLCCFIYQLVAIHIYQLPYHNQSSGVGLGVVLVRSVCGLVAGTALFYLVCVLLGRQLVPNNSSLSSSLVLCSLLSHCCVSPGACLIGASKTRWIRLFAKFSPYNRSEQSIVVVSVCMLAGSWAGSLPLPLDWDGSLQVWPVSNVLFGSVGYLFGLVASLVLILRLKWKRKKKQNIV